MAKVEIDIIPNTNVRRATVRAIADTVAKKLKTKKFKDVGVSEDEGKARITGKAPRNVAPRTVQHLVGDMATRPDISTQKTKDPSMMQIKQAYDLGAELAIKEAGLGDLFAKLTGRAAKNPSPFEKYLAQSMKNPAAREAARAKQFNKVLRGRSQVRATAGGGTASGGFQPMPGLG